MLVRITSIFFVFGSFAAAALCVPVKALEIDGYEPAVNDRFVNDGNFLGAASDFSGITRVNQENGRWVTLISPNVYLSSDHYAPSVDTTVVFFLTNDSDGPSDNRKISTTRIRIGETDFRIGTLDRPVSEDVATYAIATEVWSTGGFLGGFLGRNYLYRNATLLHVGASPGDVFSGNLDVAVGQNKLVSAPVTRTLNAPGQSPDASGKAWELDFDPPGTSDHVPYETLAVTFDSGGPLFYRDSDNSLILLGLGWYLYNANGSPKGTGFASVPDSASEIQDFLQSHSLPAVPRRPDKPILLGATVQTLEIGWSYFSGVATTIELEGRPVGESIWEPVTTLDYGEEAFTVANLAPGTTYEFRLRTTGDGGAGDWSRVLTVATETEFSAWQEENFNGEDESDAAPLADPDGDGIVNLLEFALGGDPLIPSTVLLPQPEIDGSLLGLQFFRATGGVLYFVEGSSDLVAWHTVAENPGQVGEWVTVWTEDFSFLRLRVTLP